MQVAELELECATSQYMFNTLLQQHNHLQQQYGALQHDRDALQQQQGASVRKVTNLQSQLHTANAAVQGLKEEKDAWGRERQSLAAQLAAENAACKVCTRWYIHDFT